MSGPTSPGAAMDRLTKTVTIRNQRGLHARAAAKFVKLAAEFEAEIWVERNGSEVGGQSIMGLMMLAAGPGSDLLIEAEGADGGPALSALTQLVACGFEEED